MRTITLTLATLGCFALLGGCNDAKSPAEVQNNVAEAQQSANKDVAGEIKDARKSTSDNVYDVAIARAEGDHKVATEKCESLNGDAQTACKDQADAALKLDRANAEAEHVRTS